MIITPFNGSPLAAAKEQEINAAVQARYKVGVSFCDVCNTQLLKTKFWYIDSLQLCGACFIRHTKNQAA